MKLKRIIPCLTIYEGKLIKTKNFNISNSTYVGDVLNAVRIFNEKEAEELIVLDIGASINNTLPDFNLIEKISNVSRMPICYGGGINKVDQAKIISSYGIEKISLSSIAINNFEIVKEISKTIGKQSVSVIFDVKKINNEFLVHKTNGKVNTLKNIFEMIDTVQPYVGEVVINNIDRDGTMLGYDEYLMYDIVNASMVPVVYMGGAGCINDLVKFLNRFDVVGAACGSLFIFKGQNNAVLINYPRNEILEKVSN